MEEKKDKSEEKEKNLGGVEKMVAQCNRVSNYCSFHVMVDNVDMVLLFNTQESIGYKNYTQDFYEIALSINYCTYQFKKFGCRY